MSIRILVLFMAVSTFCTISMAISTIFIPEQSDYYKNNGVSNTKHEQKITKNLRLKMQQLQQREQEEEQDVQLQRRQQRTRHIFDPFDFNNLRQLQEEKEQKQISVRQNYNNNNSNDYVDTYNELEQQQQQKQQQQQHRDKTTIRKRGHQKQWQLVHSKPYKDNTNNKNVNDNNEGNEYKSNYPYYLFDNNSNSNNNNNDNNDNRKNSNNDKTYNRAQNNNDSDDDDVDDDDDDDVVDYSNGNPNNGDCATPLSTHQDDFRLQLSDRNEPVSNKNKSNNNINNNNNNSNNNKKSSSYPMYTVNTRNDGHRNSRTDISNVPYSATHQDVYKNNKNNSNNNSENNKPKSLYSDGNGAATDTRSGRHTFKIRDSERHDAHHYPEDGFVKEDNQNSYDTDDELGMELPYGIQNVRKRSLHRNQELESSRIDTTYQSLCPTKRISIPLDTIGYEYRPNHYIEVTCAHNFLPIHTYGHSKNKICTEAGFSCIQLNRTIHLIRRSKLTTINCWESEIRIVPSGCECMWPMHNNGDIIAYHEPKKRLNPVANIIPAADYTPGVGYQQLLRQIELVDLDGARREEDNDGIYYEKYFLN